MPRINLAKRPPIHAHMPIVPLRAPMRSAMHAGVDPYDNRATVETHWKRYARKCGAVPLSDVEVRDVIAALDVAAIQRMQAE